MVMKTLVVTVVCALVLLFAVGATQSDERVVDALKEQNKQLARIAASLERISGQQPGWKLPRN
jgi:outer membrane lipoprotein-sorting protein